MVKLISDDKREKVLLLTNSNLLNKQEECYQPYESSGGVNLAGLSCLSSAELTLVSWWQSEADWT